VRGARLGRRPYEPTAARRRANASAAGRRPPPPLHRAASAQRSAARQAPGREGGPAAHALSRREGSHHLRKARPPAPPRPRGRPQRAQAHDQAAAPWPGGRPPLARVSCLTRPPATPTAPSCAGA